MTEQDEHLSTDHLLKNLKGHTISSGFVTVLGQAVQFALNLGAVMVLARLLAPKDFGLVAMVTTIMGFLRVFSDAGLSTATVQRDGITHAQVSNLFWVNVGLGGAVTLALFVASPLIAWFYREPRLVWVNMALSITFLITAATVQHMALLKRQMRFGALALIQIISLILGVAVGIGMAWSGTGYWSLVGMQLSTTLFSFPMLWAASHWRPCLPSRERGMRSLLVFGTHLSISSFLWSVARHSDSLIIGRYYGSSALGLYSRAEALMIRPVMQFMSPMESVFLPTLARVQAQPDRYRRIFLQTFEVLALASFLLTGLLLPLSKPLILTVLGPQWEDAAFIFACFTLAALYYPFGSIATWLLTSQGRGRDFLLSASISSLLAVISFLIGLPFGAVGIAFSYSAVCLLINMPIGNYIAGRSGPVSTGTMWRSFFRHLPLWFVVCASTWLMRQAVANYTSILQLIVCVPVGLLSGIIFIWAYPPSRKVALNLFETLSDWRQNRQGNA